MTQLLIDGGVDVSASDKHGSTPLHFALRYKEEEVARLLRDRDDTGTQHIAARTPSSSTLIICM